jgi:hypothetical protein
MDLLDRFAFAKNFSRNPAGKILKRDSKQ